MQAATQAVRYTIYTIFDDGHRNNVTATDIELYKACVGLSIMGSQRFFQKVEGCPKVVKFELRGTDGSVVETETWEDLVARMETTLDAALDNPARRSTDTQSVVDASQTLGMTESKKKTYVVIEATPVHSYRNGPSTMYSYCMCEGAEDAEAKMQAQMEEITKSKSDKGLDLPQWLKRMGKPDYDIAVDFAYVDPYYGYGLYAVSSTNGKFCFPEFAEDALC